MGLPNIKRVIHIKRIVMKLLLGVLLVLPPITQGERIERDQKVSKYYEKEYEKEKNAPRTKNERSSDLF